jgi:hypothetical protein
MHLLNIIRVVYRVTCIVRSFTSCIIRSFVSCIVRSFVSCISYRLRFSFVSFACIVHSFLVFRSLHVDVTHVDEFLSICP